LNEISIVKFPVLLGVKLISVISFSSNSKFLKLFGEKDFCIIIKSLLFKLASSLLKNEKFFPSFIWYTVFILFLFVISLSFIPFVSFDFSSFVLFSCLFLNPSKYIKRTVKHIITNDKNIIIIINMVIFNLDFWFEFSEELDIWVSKFLSVLIYFIFWL